MKKFGNMQNIEKEKIESQMLSHLQLLRDLIIRERLDRRIDELLEKLYKYEQEYFMFLVKSS
jgi:GGDEF domain-containing protein